MIAIIVSHPRRTTMSNVIHAATRVARPMKIVPIIVKESGGLYVESMIMAWRCWLEAVLAQLTAHSLIGV
jgi:hypothetical protein